MEKAEKLLAIASSLGLLVEFRGSIIKILFVKMLS